MIITNSTSDSPYFEQMLAFLQSLKVNSPAHTINVMLVNYPKNQKEFLVESFENFTFEDRMIEFPKDKRFSMIILRAQQIKECFECYKEPVAWLDTDVLIRKDLSEFLEIKPNELKILYRGLPKKPGPADSPINAGIFNIGYSGATYDFICDWLAGCKNNPKWGQGQMEFWKSYNKYKDEIDLIKMSRKFNDLGGYKDFFHKDSVMWHCKQNHFDNPKFQKEFKYYLDMVK